MERRAIIAINDTVKGIRTQRDKRKK